jgi:hypothetical protein
VKKHKTLYQGKAMTFANETISEASTRKELEEWDRDPDGTPHRLYRWISRD